MIDNSICDDKVAVFYSKKNRGWSGLQHIDFKQYVIHERIKDGYVVIKHIGTEDMVTDPLTKNHCVLKCLRIIALIWICSILLMYFYRGVSSR